MSFKKVKNSSHLDEFRRRAQLKLMPHAPMIRLHRESARSQYGHLPTIESLAVLTPLGHYKTKALELGWDPQIIMCAVAAYLTQHANNHAFHNQNDQPIGSRMYEAMREIIGERCCGKRDQMRIFNETFIL
ncbi:MAG: hypothetical protein UY31_C0063G0002 [Candidatus Wolfebacteria bacterium GW2011_GWE1_48_7]|uniref:Uncharacterized protein n=2 Tax=Candidatus Wolfeibacteriota TaxID=1752735 RepID=A0A0G1WGN9_9BACT|nr:MAG: hypothetical protein UX70_C0001G0562 [Candidatus Wolfebacteria bacterium GW2011_GWB1_47_1]KKU36999.1 MAG: hypothetical protein UX49_C0004G0018 [Candidatus Wolfebacteria bacterium GW2011_GWC2_46_275]KKU42507.1 MAG: hypothetical protein UX58_C0002G0221 [Candidatus Wolfebacteria bacterium GW2011_GWB2_46_69]KKU53884.1 MAG: hypothetical protein UX76_C0008G0007 [Candidatus Wolfebacteria bacterium GW2011_GWC1_47_103]KKU59660.1 MAG: hypothetical protein UX83_C0003G0075 [Candidatus Wolfebacteria